MAAKKTKTKKTSKKSSASVKKTSSKSTKEPTSMDDLLAQYGDNTAVGLSRGDKVEGTIVQITPKQVIVDIGGKSEGIIAEKAYQEARDFIKTLNVGDKVKAGVIVGEAYDGITILSFRHTAQDATWEKIENAQEKDSNLVVTGKGLNQSGLTVDFEGLTGFVPLSQVGSKAAKKPQDLVNRQFEVKVLEQDRDSNKVIFSERHVSEAGDIEKGEEALKKIKVGDIYEGEVVAVTNFGCFVSFEIDISKKEKGRVEGLVHVSELSWDKVGKPSDVVKEGDVVEVKVIGKEDATEGAGNDGKLSLSIKQATKDPWDEMGKKYKKDMKLEGEVTNVTDYGVFVKLEEGIEGLIHLTKIPPGKSYEKGDKVNVYVEEVDTKKKQIALGIVLTAKPVGYR